MKVRLAGILTRLLSLLHQIFVRFILFFFVLVAENGGICAVCGCVGFAVWALPQMGADALFSAFFYFLKLLRYLFTTNFSVRFASPSDVISRR
jgi:hypothetical protein